MLEGNVVGAVEDIASSFGTMFQPLWDKVLEASVSAQHTLAGQQYWWYDGTCLFPGYLCDGAVGAAAANGTAAAAGFDTSSLPLDHKMVLCMSFNTVHRPVPLDFVYCCCVILVALVECARAGDPGARTSDRRTKDVWCLVVGCVGQ